MAKRTSYIVKATCKLDEAEAVTFYVAQAPDGGECLALARDRALRFSRHGAQEEVANWDAAMGRKYGAENGYTFEAEKS